VGLALRLDRPTGRASGDYAAKLPAIDPHRIRSYSKRQMRRYRDDQRSRPFKVAQTFFVLDADTHQPVCFTVSSSARTATTAAIELLELAAKILSPRPGESLVPADLEHQSAELFDHAQLHTPFDLLVPMKNQRPLQKQLHAIPPEQFTRRWAGFATAKLPYQMVRSATEPIFQFAQRTGERPDDYRFGAFLSTTDRDIVVTYYNAPNVERLREQYEHLPERLSAEHIDPHVPWLYDFELDFRFR